MARAVTVLGGPHARCYPEDAGRYFDYVLGFTDKALVREVLRDCASHRPAGLQLSARRHPLHLPGVRERWKFIAPTIAKTPALKLVPMIGSLGCPYTCSFCIDAEVDYQESWYTLGAKSKTGQSTGLEKVRLVSEHLNTILRYIPYVQANFVLGLDTDEGHEPFALTKRFIDLTPGVFPAFSLLSAFGQAAPLNLELQRDGRVLPTPFHFLDNNRAANVRPKNYSWSALYDHVIGVRKHSFSTRAVARRFLANRTSIPRWLNVLRACSSEGSGRIRYDSAIRRLLDHDVPFRRFVEGETHTLPAFYVDQVRKDLGHFWPALPESALSHDPMAYLRATEARTCASLAARPAPGALSAGSVLQG